MPATLKGTGYSQCRKLCPIGFAAVRSEILFATSDSMPSNLRSEDPPLSLPSALYPVKTFSNRSMWNCSLKGLV
jgi:hypothetical protein